jgi:hypothetical protein
MAAYAPHPIGNVARCLHGGRTRLVGIGSRCEINGRLPLGNTGNVNIGPRGADLPFGTGLPTDAFNLL